MGRMEAGWRNGRWLAGRICDEVCSEHDRQSDAESEMGVAGKGTRGFVAAVVEQVAGGRQEAADEKQAGAARSVLAQRPAGRDVGGQEPADQDERGHRSRSVDLHQHRLAQPRPRVKVVDERPVRARSQQDAESGVEQPALQGREAVQWRRTARAPHAVMSACAARRSSRQGLVKASAVAQSCAMTVALQVVARARRVRGSTSEELPK